MTPRKLPPKPTEKETQIARKKIVEAMSILKVNQREFAKKLGISPAAVSMWLRCENLKISLEMSLMIENITQGKIKARELRPTTKKTALR